MKFLDYWREFSRCCPLDITDSEMAKNAFEAGIQEGIDRKREWVGLTEEDIQAILKEWVQTDMTVREMLREAEAKLKEKNQ